jgi:hypothetical protein
VQCFHIFLRPFNNYEYIIFFLQLLLSFQSSSINPFSPISPLTPSAQVSLGLPRFLLHGGRHFIYIVVVVVVVVVVVPTNANIYSKYSNICPTRCNVTQFILSGNCSTCFGWYHHPSSGTQTTIYSMLFVTPLLLSAAIAAGSSNGVTNARCCRYSCLRSWWWVVIPPETCRAVSR